MSILVAAAAAWVFWTERMILMTWTSVGIGGAAFVSGILLLKSAKRYWRAKRRNLIEFEPSKGRSSLSVGVTHASGRPDRLERLGVTVSGAALVLLAVATVIWYC